MTLTKKQIVAFQRMIFTWWEKHRRDLPWRRTRDPYKILVSEVMLQQTQVARVIPKYREFIKRYPTITALSRASTADVLRIWKGLGYNRRALYLTKIHSIPKTETELVKLPGVGTYTARAILVFAHKKDIALVDTNIHRIITHFFFYDKVQKPSIIQDVADQLVPKDTSWEWHQALMDYGAAHRFDIPRKKQTPFKNSNRFWRGRVIDILRDGPVKEKVLLKKFSKSVIEELIRDDLIKRKNGTLVI